MAQAIQRIIGWCGLEEGQASARSAHCHRVRTAAYRRAVGLCCWQRNSIDPLDQRAAAAVPVVVCHERGEWRATVLRPHSAEPKQQRQSCEHSRHRNRRASAASGHSESGNESDAVGSPRARRREACLSSPRTSYSCINTLRVVSADKTQNREGWGAAVTIFAEMLAAPEAVPVVLLSRDGVTTLAASASNCSDASVRL